MGRKLITLSNARSELTKGGVIQRERIFWSENRWKKYKLLKSITIKLSNNEVITIDKGFEWDLSSSPRIFWSIVPPDGDFEIASLIHDYLYQKKITTRRFADKEMYKWSKVVNSTNKWSFKNIDNWVRFVAVTLFGGFVWRR